MKEPEITIPLREYIDLIRRTSSALIGFSAVDTSTKGKIQQVEGWKDLCAFEPGANGDVHHLKRIDEFRRDYEKAQASKAEASRRRSLALAYERKLDYFLGIITKEHPTLAAELKPRLREDFYKGKISLMKTMNLWSAVQDIYNDYHTPEKE